MEQERAAQFEEETSEAPTRKQLSLANLYQRVRWAIPPLTIALGVRLFVLVFTQMALRLIAPTSEHGALKIWVRYDAGWYFSIVQNGYSFASHGASNVAFFPLYPMIVWAANQTLQPIFGASALLIAALAVSYLSFAGAAVLLYKLTLNRFGRQTAIFTVVLLSTFPFGVFFGAPYTESLYLLLALTAFYAMEQRMWWLAGVAALLAGAVRPPGFLVGVCVILAYALDWYTTRHRLRLDILSLALTPLGVFAYLLYCQLRFGDALAFAHAASRGWNRGPMNFGGVRILANLLLHPTIWFVTSDTDTIIWTLYGFVIVGCLVSVVFIYRKIGAVYAFFALASVFIPLLTTNTPISLGRYASVAFPCYMILAYYLRGRPALREVIVVVFSGALIVAALLFVQARGVY